MARLGIAMDLGTSGIRAQAIDLSTGEVLSTAITLCHPLPGLNVMDQIRIVLARGLDFVNEIMIRAINRVIGELGIPVDQVSCFGVCGNPVQLSLFQGIDVWDLAYSGYRKLKSMGVTPAKREAVRIAASEIRGLTLPGACEVVIPPAVRHEVGADALALIIQTGMLEKNETAIAIDFGSNAEMAIFHEGVVVSGSAAAGPALEEREISCGMAAASGAICDLNVEGLYHRLILLDENLFPTQGPLIDFRVKGIVGGTDVPRPTGITGTGTIAIIQQAMAAGLINLPHIETMDRLLHLGDDVYMTQEDVSEAGKAIGAIRAGYMSLCQHGGILPEEIHTAYLSGASGTYIDAVKAQKVGLIPPCVGEVFHVGNTSLAMARELVIDPDKLDEMIELGDKIKDHHCMFASSATFKKIFLLELSYWTEGMPMSEYRRFLKRYGFVDLIPAKSTPEVFRTVTRDIDDPGRHGLRIISDVHRERQEKSERAESEQKCLESVSSEDGSE